MRGCSSGLIAAIRRWAGFVIFDGYDAMWPGLTLGGRV
jgi:hypothetical protein